MKSHTAECLYRFNPSEWGSVLTIQCWPPPTCFNAERNLQTASCIRMRSAVLPYSPICQFLCKTEWYLVWNKTRWFLAKRDYVTFGFCYRKSVCRLSSLTLVHPTQAVEHFGNISLSLSTLTIPWSPYKILRRSSKGKPSIGCVKRQRGSKLQRFWTCQRLYK